MRRKNRLKILLIILISIFIMFAAAALLLASFQKSAREAQQKKEAIENAAKLTPTPEPTAIPSPSPTPRPTATPTPVPEQRVTFNPDDFWDYWYSTDGLVTINVYNISQNAVSFSFYQTDAGQTQAVSADITAEVAGNAAAFSFGDSAGNSASVRLLSDYIFLCSSHKAFCLCNRNSQRPRHISRKWPDHWGTQYYFMKKIRFPCSSYRSDCTAHRMSKQNTRKILISFSRLMTHLQKIPYKTFPCINMYQ